MKVLNKFLFLLLFLLFCALLQTLFALDIPKPKARVNDYADMLTTQEEAMLEKRIEEYDKSTSNQIAILTIKSLEGEVLEDFSIRVAKSWGIGQKGKDNGVLILISKAEHKIRIEVGYGLEGVIPDGVCGRIIREDMAPNFKQNKTYEGINSALDKIALAVKGEYEAEPHDEDDEAKLTLYLIFIGVLMFISGLCGIAHFLIGGIVGGIGTFFVTNWMYSPSAFILFLAAIIGFVVGMAAKFILEALALGGGDSSYSSSFGGGSSDSGGFSGFGGGGFGGGGASGGW